MRKKLLTMMLILAMVLTSTVVGFAGEGLKITITNSANDKTAHTYEAYQIFDGDISGDKLVNITWGSGVDGAALLADLVSIEEFKDCTTPEDVAKVLGGLNDAAKVDAFAEVVAKHLTTVADEAATDASLVAVLEVAEEGYYFVKDKAGTVDNELGAATKYILKVVGNVEVTAKSDVPNIEKKIDVSAETDGSDLVDYNNAAVGDVVNYHVTSKVPNMDGYTVYKFVVTDKMSGGLTYNNDVKVTIGGTEVTPDSVTVSPETPVAGTETTIVIKINDLTGYTTGDDIVITYSATVNDKAVIGAGPNPNTVKLNYSNDPNTDGFGDPEGETPWDTVYTYITGLKVIKIDGDTQKPLTGAEFKITGTKLNNVIVEGTKYEKATDGTGTHWLLNNGTYTTTDPAAEGVNSAAYASTTDKYKLVTYKETVVKAEDVEYSAFVDAEGYLVFDGLAAGEYEITEITAPDGYNAITDPIEVTITWAEPNAETGTNCTWTYEGADIAADGTATITVANYTGAVLPGTGGIGTTIFYILGGVLVAGAAIMLIARKRMNNEE